MANPEESFVIISISREEIARTINDLLCAGRDVIAPDSDLLTRKLCVDLTERLGALYSALDDHEDFERHRNEVIGAWNILLDSLPLEWDDNEWVLKPKEKA